MSDNADCSYAFHVVTEKVNGMQIPNKTISFYYFLHLFFYYILSGLKWKAVFITRFCDWVLVSAKQVKSFYVWKKVKDMDKTDLKKEKKQKNRRLKEKQKEIEQKQKYISKKIKTIIKSWYTSLIYTNAVIIFASLVVVLLLFGNVSSLRNYVAESFCDGEIKKENEKAKERLYCKTENKKTSLNNIIYLTAIKYILFFDLFLVFIFTIFTVSKDKKEISKLNSKLENLKHLEELAQSGAIEEVKWIEKFNEI